jgi:hypothetical protein
MHEPLLAQAALPAPVRICGIPLAPYSLGHELFLIRENSPFIFGGTVLPQDLFEAVWICSGSFDDCRRAPHTWTYLLKLWLLKRRIARCDNFEREAESFRQYRESGTLEFPISELPRPGESGPPPRPAGAPYLLRLHDFVCWRYRLSLSEGWDFPAGEAKMRWATYWEEEQGLSIYNYHDAEFDRFVAQQEAKKKERLCPQA